MRIRLAFPDRDGVDFAVSDVPREGDSFTWLDGDAEDHLYRVDHVGWTFAADEQPSVIVYLMNEENDDLEERMIRRHAEIAGWLRQRAAELAATTDGHFLLARSRAKILREEADLLDDQYAG